MKNKITLINIVSTLVLQIVTIVSGFVIPKLILTYFGSDANGLVSSLNQFLSYINLVEGGITGVIMANLYKPLYENNYNKISSIINTSNKFYKTVGKIFVVYTLALATIYPLLFHSSFSYVYVFSLTIILSLSLLIQYMFSLSLRTLLNADKKVYIVSFTQTIILLLNIILVYISIKIYPNIHILKAISGLLFLLQPIILNNYVKKRYKLNNNVITDDDLLKSRWNGFSINVAAFIHNSTDIVLLTVFSNLSTVSIYSVYALVSSGLKQIVNSITIGINPTIGNAYAKGNILELNEKMDVYEYVVLMLVFFIFTIGGLLITPFVMLYTRGIDDVNYYQPLFGILLIISEGIYLLKFPHLNLAYSANRFKEITKPAFIEAGLNIVLSIILVNKIGIIGVAIGTIVAMTYRLLFHVYYTTKIIKNRNQIIFYNKLFIFIITAIIGIFISTLLVDVKYTLSSWMISAIIYSIIFAILYMIMSLMFFRKELSFFKKYIYRKKD